MASGYEVVDEDHGGGQEGVASEWKTIRAVFPNFAGLPAKRGDLKSSAVLKCHGLEWRIQLYPGGHPKSSEENAFITLRLWSNSDTNTNKIKAKYKIRVPSAAGKGVGSGEEFRLFNGSCWGKNNYAKREDVLDSSKKYLVDGNLVVEVEMQVLLDKPPTWLPTNTLSLDMLEILDSADAETTDVSFEIGDGGKTSTRSRKDGHMTFYAHKAILSKRAPALAALTDDCSPGTAIPISDVHPDLFRMLLRFIYGGEVPGENVLTGEGRGIIRIADRFGCTGLKLAAEAELAAAGITTENAADIILFADGMNCAMLKETAMDYFVTNAQDVMASEGFAQVKESPVVMAELMAAMASGSKKRPASSGADSERDHKRMRVATLRQKLDDKGLDVDGSREMLAARLEEAENDVVEVE